jgi:hypothetical protein
LKILFLNPGVDDYLGDGLFHGLRMLYGSAVVDYPRMDHMYTDYPTDKRMLLANKGKTLYCMLEDEDGLVDERKSAIQLMNQYDVVVVIKPSMNKQLLSYAYKSFRKQANMSRVMAIVDGDDSERLFQYTHLSHKITKDFASLFKKFTGAHIFKREFYGHAELIGLPSNSFFDSLIKRLFPVYPISMSVPESLIDYHTGQFKTKDFTEYIVDEEIASRVGKVFGKLGQKNFVFSDADTYFSDIRNSRFGVTVKRGGWDSLRHYEYAAKGTVLCFKNLDDKPLSCAPHNLGMHNAILYHSAQDLFKQIEELSEERYKELSKATTEWVLDYTTEKVAKRFINCIIYG